MGCFGSIQIQTQVSSNAPEMLNVPHIFCLQDVPLTWGLPLHSHHLPSRDQKHFCILTHQEKSFVPSLELIWCVSHAEVWQHNNSWPFQGFFLHKLFSSLPMLCLCDHFCRTTATDNAHWLQENVRLMTKEAEHCFLGRAITRDKTLHLQLAMTTLLQAYKARPNANILQINAAIWRHQNTKFAGFWQKHRMIQSDVKWHCTLVTTDYVCVTYICCQHNSNKVK